MNSQSIPQPAAPQQKTAVAAPQWAQKLANAAPKQQAAMVDNARFLQSRNAAMAQIGKPVAHAQPQQQTAVVAPVAKSSRGAAPAQAGVPVPKPQQSAPGVVPANVLAAVASAKEVARRKAEQQQIAPTAQPDIMAKVKGMANPGAVAKKQEEAAMMAAYKG